LSNETPFVDRAQRPPGEIAPDARPTSREGRRILVSCGEPSGDLYGAELVNRLRPLVRDLEVFGLGGDRLAAEGAHLVAHVRDLAVVGLLEVVAHLRRLRGIFHELLEQVDRLRPELAVLVDYPDFNLRLARELRKRGVRVVYYVSPQLWAWRGGRIRTVRATVARMLVIFPFEEALYRRAGVPVSFVGHPLIDSVRPEPDPSAYLTALRLDPQRPVVAVLPGSRPQEVLHNLPPLVGGIAQIAAARPDVQFVLAAAPSLPLSLFEGAVGDRPVQLVHGQTQSIVGASTLALVASGTATVETALVGTPMVVVYRVAPLTYLLGRPFVRVRRFAMVNLIAEEAVVPELIQADFTPDRVAEEALLLLGDPERRRRMRDHLGEVKRRLGGPGASLRAAEAVASELAGVRSGIDRVEGSV
jgi:lipid-A-disaccharide synthase